MRRIINFRASLFIAVGLILGIFSSYEFLFGNFWFGLVSLILIFALGILLYFTKSKMWVGMVAMLLSVMFGFGISQLSYVILNKNEVCQQNVTIVGRVCDLDFNGADSPRYYLEDCVDSDGVKYNGKVSVAIFNEEINSGDIITIRGELNSVYPIKSFVETYYLRNNIRYELNTASLISVSNGELKIDETIRKYFFEVSAQFAPKNGDVLYALLSGDRSALDSAKKDSFKIAGIIHLLAVSGLHVGFVVAIICFVLKRFKLHPLIELSVLIVPLMIYAYICKFTPSVIRAIIMLICSYVSHSVFGRYDLLTSLSWAVVILLLINPFNLFDAGFQLSVMSVFGISTLYGSINRLMSKRSVPKIAYYFINSLAVSLSCSVATFFTLQINYGYAPIIGILLNIVAIPLVTIAFALGWVGILPSVFHYVLWLADWILEGVVILAKCVSSLSFSVVYVPAITFSAVVVALWLFVLGGYVNLKKIGKIITHSAMSILLALCIGLSFVKLPSKTQAYISYGYDGEALCVLTSSDGEAAIIGSFSNVGAYVDAYDFIKKYKIDKCTLYFTNFANANQIIVKEALNNLPIDIAYRLDFSYNEDVKTVFAEYQVPVYQQMQNTSHGESVAVTSIFDGGLRAVLMRTDDLAVTQLFGNDYAVTNYLELGVYSDIYILPNGNEAYSERKYLTLSSYQSKFGYNYGANKYGNFTIAQKGGTIKIKFR